MKTAYITQQGCTVKKKSRRLLVVRDSEVLAEIPTFGLDGVIVFGNAQVTTQAASLLLDEGISVTFLSQKGRYRGTLIPADSKNVILRVAQYERHLDPQFAHRFAAAIVEAKLRNGRQLLSRFRRNHPETSLEAEISNIDAALDKVAQQPSIPSLLGIEGSATAVYFRGFAKMCRRELAFTQRTRRPPRDPLNAALSFGYTLIMQEIFSLLMAGGFDPYIGFLHGIDYGRPSLALDLVEEFRHPIIDRLVLSLANTGQITKGDFVEGDDGSFLFRPESLRKFLTLYDARMNGAADVSMEEALDTKTYRTVLRRQIGRAAKSIQTNGQYEPYREA